MARRPSLQGEEHRLGEKPVISARPVLAKGIQGHASHEDAGLQIAEPGQSDATAQP